MTHDFIIYEGLDVHIVLRFEYSIEAASGDGRNEPREPARAILESGELIRQHYRLREGKRIWTAEDALGPAPQWALDLIDEDVLGGLLDDD